MWLERYRPSAAWLGYGRKGDSRSPEPPQGEPVQGQGAAAPARRPVGRPHYGTSWVILGWLLGTLVWRHLRSQRYLSHLAVLAMLALAMLTTQPLFTTSSNIVLIADEPLAAQPASPGGEITPIKTATPPLTDPSIKTQSIPTPGAHPLSIAQLREVNATPTGKQLNTDQPKQPKVPIKYKVQEGETISGIAEQFGVTAASILGSNEVGNPNSLQIGDELLIPPVSGLLHRVSSGDNLHDLAAVYGVTPESIAEFNLLPDPNSLQLGELLVVPGGKIQLARANSAGRGGRPSPPPAAATGSFRWPAGGTITQYFGENGHSGLDIASGMGSPIYAADSGVVVTALKLNYGYGWYLVIDHENGYRTLYSHLSAFFADYGERVTKGQTIAAMGNTGLSTGPHLHFEVFVNGVRVNPLKYLP